MEPAGSSSSLSPPIILYDGSRRFCFVQTLLCVNAHGACLRSLKRRNESCH